MEVSFLEGDRENRRNGEPKEEGKENRGVNGDTPGASSEIGGGEMEEGSEMTDFLA